MERVINQKVVKMGNKQPTEKTGSLFFSRYSFKR